MQCILDCRLSYLILLFLKLLPRRRLVVVLYWPGGRNGESLVFASEWSRIAGAERVDIYGSVSRSILSLFFVFFSGQAWLFDSFWGSAFFIVQASLKKNKNKNLVLYSLCAYVSSNFYAHSLTADV